MTWSLVVSRFFKCGQIGGSIKIDFPYTAVMCIQKCKTLLKAMFSIFEKSRCKNWVYLVVEFSGICDKESKNPKDMSTEVPGNGDAEKSALAYFSYFQISERLQYIYGKLGLPIFYKIVLPC